MIVLGNLRKDAPLRWTAVVAIRLLFVGLAVGLIAAVALTPYPGTHPTTRARAEASEVGKAVGVYRTLTGRMPASLDDLRRPLARNDGEPLIDVGDDPWGRPYRFTIDPPRAITVSSLGADGEPGGGGADEDIVLRWPPEDGSAPR